MTHLLPPALFLTLLPLSLGATSQCCLPAPSVGRMEEVLMRQSLINPVTLEPFHFCQSHMCANLRSQPNGMKFVKKIESFFHLTPLRTHHSGLCFYILFVCTSVFLFNGGETVTLFFHLFICLRQLSYFSPCFDTPPTQKQLRRGATYSVLWFQGISVYHGKEGEA